MSGYVGRFAPSPTGPLHFGSLVAAVAGWLDARAAGGRWLLRIEDVDTTRCVPGAEEAILRLLRACALHWDGEIVRQSERTVLYEEALERLRSQGAVYRCHCSRREIADSGLAGPEGAIYPGTCRRLGLAFGEPGADRLEVAPGQVAFDDRVQGTLVQDVARDIGDFVLKRRDGFHAYQLAVVVDDAAQGVTHVVRGADLLWSSPRQILLQRRLGLATPRYAHVPVAANARGEKLSKQTRARAIAADEAPAALRAALAFLGQPLPRSESPRALLAEAARTWDIARVPAVVMLAAGDVPGASRNA